MARCLAAVAVASTMVVCSKKGNESQPAPAPPAPGGASTDVVATNIGNGLALPEGIAPTSTKWTRTTAVGEASALLVGRAGEEAVALVTTDGGKSWRSLRQKAGQWSAWALGDDGTVALAGGDAQPGKPHAGRPSAASRVKLWLAPPGGALGQPSTVVPRDPHLLDVTATISPGAIALLGGEMIGLIVDRGRAQLAAFGTPATKPLPSPVPLGARRAIRAAYGHPPQLLTAAGGRLWQQAWPKPKVPLGEPRRIVGVAASAQALTQLNLGPSCDSGPWSFRYLAPSSRTATVLAVSPDAARGIAVPTGQRPGMGCGATGVVVAGDDTTTKQLVLTRCELGGRCTTGKNPPFEKWPRSDELQLVTSATKQGVVATLSMRAGTRWAVYLAQSLDGGSTYELPRIIGEGKTEQGRFEVGALIALPGRVVMLLSADVTGTSRRGWYALASDDGGSNWGAP